jgi:autotransporter-associated beta strand protein
MFVIELHRSALLAIGLFLAATFGAQSVATASTFWWDTNSSGTWSSSANWWTTSAGSTNGGPPSVGGLDTAVFNGTTANGNVTAQLSASAAVTSLLFNNTGTTLLESTDATPQILALGTSGITIAASAGSVILGNASNPLTVQLNGTQSWSNSGALTVVNGITSNGSAFGLTLKGSGTTYFNGNTTIAGIVGTGYLQNNPGGIAYINGQFNTGTKTVVQAGTLYYQSGTSTWDNATDFDGVSGGTLNVTGGSLTIKPKTSSFFMVRSGSSIMTVSGGTFALGSACPAYIGGASGTSGTNSLTISGSGIVDFSQATTIGLGNAAASAGTLSLLGGGLLMVGSVPISVTVSGGSGVINLNGGTLQATTNNSNLIGTTLGGVATSIGAGGAIFDTQGNSVTISQALKSGAVNDGGLTKYGAGTLTLSASNNFQGATAINGGTLLLGNSAALGSSTLDYNSYGGSLSFGTLTSAKFGGLKGSQNLTLNGSSGDVALTVGGNNASTTYSGSLTDSGGGGSLSKIGTGSLTLNGNNGYVGSTAISNGTLAVNGSIASNNTISVASPATLAGNGSIGGNSSTTTLTGNATVNLSGGTIGGALNATGGNWLGNGTVVGAVNASGNTFTVVNGATLNASGGFNLTAGTLTGQGTVSGGTMTLYSGALIAPGASAANGNVGTLSLGNFATFGGGQLNFDLSGTNTTAGSGVNDLIQVAGNLSLGGGITTLGINSTSGAALVTGSAYTLITYGGTLDPIGGSLAFPAGLLSGRQTANFNYGTGNNSAVTLTINGGAANLTWIGTNSTTWVDDTGVQPWTSAGSPAGDYFTAGDNVTFDNHASPSAGTVTLSGAVSPGSVTVSGTNNFTFTGLGSISGATGLTILGPGSLTVGNYGNSYSGATAVQGGTLALGIDNPLPAATAVVLGSSASAGTFDLAGYSQTIGSLGVAPGATAANQIVTASINNSTLTFNGGTAASAFTGAIQDAAPNGTLNLTVSAGTLDLTGAAANYSGATSINGGLLQLSSLPNSSSINIATGGTLGFVGANTNLSTNINNSGIVGYSGGSGTLSGTINGAGGLTVNSGLLTLSGQMLYSGTTTVNGGTLGFAPGDSLPSANTLAFGGSGALDVGSGAQSVSGLLINPSASGNLFGSGGTLTVGGGSASIGSDTNGTSLTTALSVNGMMLNFSPTTTAYIAYTKTGAGSGNNGATSSLTVGSGTVNATNMTVAYANYPGGSWSPNAVGTITLNSGGVLAVSSTLTPVFANHGNGTKSATVNINSGGLLLVNTIASPSNFANLTTTVNLSGGTIENYPGTGLTINNFAVGSTSGTINLANTGTFAIDAGQTGIVSQAISGSGALNMAGPGLLALNATNTYTGGTNVSGGTLLMNGSLSTSSAVSVTTGAAFGGSGSAGQVGLAAGSILQAGYSGTGSLNLTGLAFSGPGTINAFDIGSFNAAAAIVVSGSNATSMPSGATIVNLQGTLQPSGTVHILQYSGAIQGSGYSFSVGTVPASTRSITSSLVNNAGANSGNVDWIYAVDYPYWTGGGDQKWNLTSGNNWTLALSGSATTFMSGDNVIFDDRASSSTPTVTIDAANVTPSSITFNNGTAAYTIQGSYGIAGSATTLTINGPGAVTLATSDNYSGGTTLNGGALRIGNNAALGTGSLTLKGGTLTASGNPSSTIVNPVTIAGNVTFGDAANTGNLLLNGSSTLSGAVQLNIENGPSNLVKIGGVLGGSGSPTITGNGLFFIATAPSYSAATTINGGTMQVGFGTTLLTVPSVQFNLGPAGTLEYFTNASNTAQMPWNKLNGSGTFVFQGVNDNATNIGASSATMSSPTNIVPGGFTGTMIVDDAQIDPRGASAGFGGTQNLIVRNGGQLWLSLGPTTYGAGTTLHLSGPGWYDGNGYNVGALRLTSSAVWAGRIVLDGDVRIGASNITSTSLNSGTITGAISGAHTLEVGGGNVIYGTLTLAPSTANSFTGLKVSSGGTAATVSAGSAGAFPTATPAALTMNGGNLKLNGFSFPFADLTGTSGTIQNGSATTAGTITIGSDNTSTSYGGTLLNGGAASLALDKTGAGTLTLTGTNTYTGGTTVNSGTLIVTNSQGIADGTNLYVGDPTLLSQLPAAVVPSPIVSSAAVAAPAAVPEPGALALIAAANVLITLRVMQRCFRRDRKSGRGKTSLAA